MKGPSKALDLLVLATSSYHAGDKKSSARFFRLAMLSPDLQESLSLVDKLNEELSTLEVSEFDDWEENDEFSSELDKLEDGDDVEQEGPPANTDSPPEKGFRKESYDAEGDEHSSYEDLLAELENSETYYNGEVSDSDSMKGKVKPADSSDETDMEQDVVDAKIRGAGGKVNRQHMNSLSKQAIANVLQLKKTA